MFCRLFDGPQQALHMFSNRRCPPGVCPAQRRYDKFFLLNEQQVAESISLYVYTVKILKIGTP